jgi:UrcA family protein
MNSSSRCAGLRGSIVTAIFGTLVVGFSAVSSPNPSSASITVKYADLNIHSPSGARALYERIRAAAKSACNYFWFKRDADEASCVEITVRDAVSKVNQPALSAVYNSKHTITGAGKLVSRKSLD